MNLLYKDDGTQIHTHVDIEKEILEFYGGLMGTKEESLNHIDITDMRRGLSLLWSRGLCSLHM